MTKLVALDASGNTYTTDSPGTGGGTDRVFVENTQQVNATYTIAAGRNALSVGPITIAAGQTVTIATGSQWHIAG